jgi:hypothetical protein
VRIYRQQLVNVIARIRIVGAPAVGPDSGRAKPPLAGAQDDAEWFVVENEWQARHVAPMQVVRRYRGKANAGPFGVSS